MYHLDTINNSQMQFRASLGYFFNREEFLKCISIHNFSIFQEPTFELPTLLLLKIILKQIKLRENEPEEWKKNF